MSLLDTASLIVTPNGYKEGKLYSVIPSDGSGDLSVTRATTATRVNLQGLVELVPYNLLSYSEQFDNAYWNKRAGISISADTTTAPNGTLTADTVNYSSGDGYTWFFDTLAPSTSYTISVYAKGSGTLTFQAYWGTGASTGSANTLTSEWQRFSFTFTTGSTTSLGDFGFFVPNTCNIWGAQLNEGTIKPYQKTETRLNIPRLDYSNGTCPSILVEPQRTNDALYSEQFDNAAWTKYQATITANAATAPNGVVNADKFTDNTNNDIHATYAAYLISSATTISGYVKSAEYSKISISNLSDGGDVIFDLSSASVVSSSSNFVNAQIESLSNGWYRVSATTNGTSGYKAIGFSLVNNSGSLSFVGTGTSGVYIWGAQVEVGSYATSYIPTTSASVTRNADAISKTGISSLIGQTEGTLFAEIELTQLEQNCIAIRLDNGSDSGIHFYFDVNQINAFVEVSGATQASISTGAPSLGTHKLAIAYKANDVAFYVDGVLIGTDTTASIPTCSVFRINGISGGVLISAFKVKATSLWKTRLSNTQLAQLTTI